LHTARDAHFSEPDAAVLTGLPFPAIVGVFLLSAAVVAIVGTRLSGAADRLADATGLGEAVSGALLLGGATSLPGIVSSVTAASYGAADLAVSNAIGGIAVQTVFVVAADAMYPKANLEHAAASLGNMLQATLLIVLLGVPLVASELPDLLLGHVHVATPVMLAIYVFGMRLAFLSRQEPMWRPARTPETREDSPEPVPRHLSARRLWLRFAGLSAAIGVAGYVIALSGLELVAQTGLPQTAVGALFTATATSLPELVTSIAAVRRGAENLAIGGIIGGNAFDTLFLAASDVFYEEGSIFAALTGRSEFLLSVTILMSATLLMGLLRREKSGVANIGFEGAAILVMYVGAATYLFGG
jgi:cation:H+ antiporter